MRQTTTTNGSLTPKIRAVVADRIAPGRFQNAGEVVRAALRLPEMRRVPGVPTGAEGQRRG